MLGHLANDRRPCHATFDTHEQIGRVIDVFQGQYSGQGRAAATWRAADNDAVIAAAQIA